jgi:hypothetical protein
MHPKAPFPEDSIIFARSAAMHGFLVPGEHWSDALIPISRANIRPIPAAPTLPDADNDTPQPQ